jgi:hypothetical protein
MEYAHTLSTYTRHNYKEFKKALTKRYGQRDPPSYARRQLSTLRQTDQETVEDFADRVQRVALDGFPTASEDIIQQVSIEIFLHGCKERTAAYFASERCPKSLQRALKYVKASTQNLKYMGKPSFTSRQVSFDLGASEAFEEEVSVRSASKATSHSPNRSDGTGTQLKWDPKQLARDIGEILSANLQKLFSQSRSRSQSPNKDSVTCYGCNRKGHYANECPDKKAGAAKLTPPGSPRRGCFKCGDTSHFLRECPKRERSSSPVPQGTPPRG